MMQFKDVFPTLAHRSSLAAIQRLGFDNPPLRRHLKDLFGRPYGNDGALLADPVFEAVFGWRTADANLGDLAGNLLHESLVQALDNPPEDLADTYRFRRSRRPYTHQLAAWERLCSPIPQSVVVSSGTGSGKTECFMVPLLDHLARLHDQHGGNLVGVRALFLYPLNALINSQRERLRAWTHAFGGGIRFCLYNGNTPETVRSDVQNANPCEVLGRDTLRASPPPILVTNASMLEYMLVRGVDVPILARSQGMLEWVVLDEAHTYIGSQAAEAALLIRRVLHAFGVQPENVRFVATSATIGDPQGEAGQKLRAFLADVAGTDIGRVHLVAGERLVPSLDAIKEQNDLGLDALQAIDPGTLVSVPRFSALCENKTARRLRDRFTPKKDQSGVATLSEICEIVFGRRGHYELNQQQDALAWLDLISGTQDNTGDGNHDGDTFTPLRAHLFHQTISGVWTCADPACTHKPGTELDHAGWPFGRVYLEPRKHCACGSPVYEAVFCDDCGHVYLTAGDRNGHLLHLQPQALLDEFELDVEQDGGGDEEEREEENRQFKLLVCNQPLHGTSRIGVDKASRQIVTPGTEGALDVIVAESHGGSPPCPDCGATSNGTRPLFIHFRLGAPFMVTNLLPSLLEFAPDSDSPAKHPYRGRRLLAFNDSRQGTARMAGKLQQDAERNRVRGLVYHLALQHSQERDQNKIESVRKLIDDLTPLIAVKPELAGTIASLRSELAELTKPRPIDFNTLALRLSQQSRDFNRMVETYRCNVPEVFGDGGGVLELARMFLMREFGRRPKRLNNLESMGLVAVVYPALARIRDLPWCVAQNTDFTLDEWRQFLKIALDQFVRGGGSLMYPPPWKNWLGQRFTLNHLIDRDAAARAPNQRYWPRVSRSRDRSTVIRLLAHMLRLDPQVPHHEDILDGILLDAWHALTAVSNVLTLDASGHTLHLEGMAFLPMAEAWQCPVTRRLLDTALRGVTPYLPRTASPARAQCQRISLPLYDVPFGGTPDDIVRVHRGRDWLATQDSLTPLREEGFWGDLNDRVIELPPYFTAAEHSAQQTSGRLKAYEDDFKRGDLNLLSCSTTMEMGIDIGGISIVAMNNVPPHPANYLQRAGRAGRRREPRSLSMTLCKSNPHDQTVFSNTRWPFDSPLPAPRVSLDSPVIVQRHIHSLLLAAFMQEVLMGSGQEQTRLTCGMFFLNDASLAARFADWSRQLPRPDQQPVVDGVRMLQRKTCLESRSIEVLALDAARSIEAIAGAWRLEHGNLSAELARLVAGGRGSPASRAVTLQLTRMEDEYLLRELATRGFLPVYGFPTHIASFDNYTRGQFLRERRQREQGRREDNVSQRRELASRDLQTALREYAPGAEVVMDGLVFRSSGVTLNWHIPAAQADAREIQEFRWAWRCSKCGASGSSLGFDSAGHCAECGEEIKEQDRNEFLVPAGFAVDFHKEPNNDINSQRFVPVERPWVNAHGDWRPLFNGRGRYRMCTDGHILFHSRGINGTGYALCLSCGRAEPMTPGDPPGNPIGGIPTVFQTQHNKLRCSDGHQGICEGSHNEWMIKRGTLLGHETLSDMLEIQLQNEAGLWMNDKTVAQTLAVALRDELAEMVGVQASELGCDFKPALTPDRSACYSILVYDRYAAGYSSGLQDGDLATLFENARHRLDCPAQCDSVCPHCVLDFDQRFNAETLDRHAALAFLSEPWFVCN